MTASTHGLGGAPDRSAAALARWLAALSAPAYDLRLVLAEGKGPVLCRRLDAAGLMAALPWVRARNAAGHHAFCRPAAPRHVLVDDLGPAALEALAAAHRTAAVVETSDANFQAWITLSADDLAPALASAAARLLASRFGGDPGAAGWAQLGRLVGTTNRKEKHRRGDGAFPFVLLRGAQGGVDPAGAALLTEAAPLVRPAPPPVAAAALAPSLPGHAAPDTTTPAAREAAEAARRVALGLPLGARLDRSRLDHAVALRLLSRGAGAAFARAAVLAGERARGMPGPAATAYATRTVDAAARSLEGAAPRGAMADHGARPGGPGKGERPLRKEALGAPAGPGRRGGRHPSRTGRQKR